jgi:hypothetical protein
VFLYSAFFFSYFFFFFVDLFFPSGVVDVAHSIIAACPTLTYLRAEIALDYFCPEGFVGIGVPIGTGAFVRNFVAKTCRNVIK